MELSMGTGFLAATASENNGSLSRVIGNRLSHHHYNGRRHAFALLPIDGNSANSDSRGRVVRWDSQGGEAAL
jgi:hypothetical protein